MRCRVNAGLLLPTIVALAATASPASAQALAWDSLSMAGIARASDRVNAVFVDRVSRNERVPAGDWVSYLAARLDALPIPDSLGILVAVDSAVIRVRGRVMDFPADTRELFRPLLFFMDSTAVLEGTVIMGPSHPGAIRFILATISINGIMVPESILSRFMAQVGRRYPVLTETGRELIIAIPPEGRVTLERNAVRLRMLSSTGAPPG